MESSREVYVSNSNIFMVSQKHFSYMEKRELEIKKIDGNVTPKHVSKNITKIMDKNMSRHQRIKEVDGIMNNFSRTLGHEECDEFYEKREKFKENCVEIKAFDLEKTKVHRISFSNGEVNYEAFGWVPGHILNRLSMDENDDHFRIATTIGHVWRTGENKAVNNVYVLDEEMAIVGAIEGIAPGERIYSARFMGDRGYLVTFKKVDPFFVIDLADPENPEILGELKIPGYSDYLHPYDENHVIGIGKQTIEAEGGNFAWYQGVKISLFDVTDVSQPKEKSNYIIGDRGTQSLALHDPHAFLFSKDKNLLVMPISLSEKQNEEDFHGQQTFLGAYIFNISAENGIEMHGKISHTEEGETLGYYSWYNNRQDIKRSFYIGDTLYTVSNKMIKMNDLDTLEEINTIRFDNS